MSTKIYPRQKTKIPNDEIEEIVDSRKKIKLDKCKICGDKSSGNHYGVSSCDGCERFFLRTKLKNQTYRCFLGQNCLITPQNRINCKACRYQRCIEAGMFIENCRAGEGKISKISQREDQLKDSSSFKASIVANSEETVDNSDNSNSNKNSSPLSTNESVDIVVPFHSIELPAVVNNNEIELKILINQLHQAYSLQSSKVTNQIEQANMISSLNIKNLTGSDATLKDVWTELIKLTENNISSMIRYVVNIPGWNIPKNSRDFKIIINRNLFSYYWVIYSLLCIRGQFYLVLPNGIFYTREWREKIIGKEVADAVFDFCDQFNSLSLTETEKFILLPVIITSYNEGLIEKEKIQKCHDYYLRTLKYVMKLNKRDPKYIDRFSEVLCLLSNTAKLNNNNIDRIVPIIE